MGQHYDYDGIEHIASITTKHPITGRPLSEHLASDERPRYPQHEAFGLGFIIALFREQEIFDPDGKETNVANFLRDLDEHYDLEGDPSVSEDDILTEIADETELHVMDLAAVRHYYECKNR